MVETQAEEIMALEDSPQPVPALPPKSSPGRHIRAGLFLGCLAAVLLLTLSYSFAQSFFIPEFLVIVPFIALPIMSFGMLFFPGHRYLGLIGLVASGGIFYIMITSMSAFAPGC